MSKISRHSLSAVINFVVTDQDIDDIMSAVLDGGITYWCCRAEVVGDYLGEYASEQISRGGTLRLHDSEADSVTGDIDALAADMIIQYALFSDVIYG